VEQRVLRKRFDRVLGPKLGLGEIESLVIVQKTPDLTFCTFDHAAIIALVLLDMENRGVSFETVLKQCGLSRRLERKHSEERFKRIEKSTFDESHGTGVKTSEIPKEKVKDLKTMRTGRMLN
jgi:hypothetical protein